jgi:hypothetical protein
MLIVSLRIHLKQDETKTMINKTYNQNKIVQNLLRAGIITSSLMLMMSCKLTTERDFRSHQAKTVTPEVIEKPQPAQIDEPNPKPTPEEQLVDGAIFKDRAFDLLTGTGVEIFYQAKEFVKDQKQAAYQSYAQRLQCVRNVSHVLNKTGYSFTGSATYAVPAFLSSIKSQGGDVIQLPLYNGTRTSKEEIIDMLNKNFSDGIPTGAIIAGCMSENCDGEGFSAHVAIVGDKNAENDIMLYHNNWYRPNNLKGQRKAHMVSLENFYDLERPRQWMATPWINLTKNDEGLITDFESKLPGIDDLDPLNGDYYIKIALMPDLKKEVDLKSKVAHHRLVIKNNQHTAFLSAEKKRKICRTTRPFRTIDPRAAAGSSMKSAVYDEIAQYERGKTFFDYNFEFIITDDSASNGNWVKIKTYDANIYWGESKDPTYKFGEIWIARDLHYNCFEKGTQN